MAMSTTPRLVSEKLLTTHYCTVDVLVGPTITTVLASLAAFAVCTCLPVWAKQAWRALVATGSKDEGSFSPTMWSSVHVKFRQATEWLRLGSRRGCPRSPKRRGCRVLR